MRIKLSSTILILIEKSFAVHCLLDTFAGFLQTLKKKKYEVPACLCNIFSNTALTFYSTCSPSTSITCWKIVLNARQTLIAESSYNEGNSRPIEVLINWVRPHCYGDEHWRLSQHCLLQPIVAGVRIWQARGSKSGKSLFKKIYTGRTNKQVQSPAWTLDRTFMDLLNLKIYNFLQNPYIFRNIDLRIISIKWRVVNYPSLQQFLSPWQMLVFSLHHRRNTWKVISDFLWVSVVGDIVYHELVSLNEDYNSATLMFQVNMSKGILSLQMTLDFAFRMLIRRLQHLFIPKFFLIALEMVIFGHISMDLKQ